jgi:hypothetical protein
MGAGPLHSMLWVMGVAVTYLAETGGTARAAWAYCYGSRHGRAGGRPGGRHVGPLTARPE